MRLVALLLLAAGPALAQGDPCEGAVTQSELNACSREGWQQADAELNEAYAAAMWVAQDYDDSIAEALRDAQRAWIVFRDAECAAEAAFWEGGTGQPMILYSCLDAVTRQRSDDLWSISER